MYQGKFGSKNKGGSSDIYEIIAQRNSTPAPRPAAEQDIIGQRPKASRQAAPVRESVPAQAPAKQQRRAPQPPAATQEEPRRRGPRLGGVIFYTLYFLFIFMFFVATYMGLNRLRDCLLYTSPSPRDEAKSRMPSSA